VESVANQLSKLLERGYGYAFLILGVLTVIAAVLLRLDDPHKFVAGIVAGILGLGLALICMAFAFFVIDLRTRARTVESLERQNEVITEALVARAKVLDENQARAEEAAPVAGFRASQRPSAGATSGESHKRRCTRAHTRRDGRLRILTAR
jgi:hypothetical protein